MRARLCIEVLLIFAAIAPALAMEERKPAIPYWHLWTGKDGKSHLTECALTDFGAQSAGQQLQIQQPGTANIILAYNPKGDWHENPRVQWVVPLQGSFYIQAQDGSKVTLAPGNLYLGEDLNTTADADGHKGHISGSKGDDPVILLITQLDVKPTVEEPCHAK